MFLAFPDILSRNDLFCIVFLPFLMILINVVSQSIFLYEWKLGFATDLQLHLHLGIEFYRVF